MARKSKKDKDNAAISVILGAILVLIIIFIGGDVDNSIIGTLTKSTEENPLKDVDSDITQTTNTVNGNLVVDFIDVGQGDSILIRQGDATMLIDGGTSECKDDLLNYLESQEIDKFEYIVGTHPHEDHIGSLDDVVTSYDFDSILFPKVTTTTKTFENLVLAVKNKGKTFTTPEVGKEYELGDAKFQILAPNSDKYSSLNDYSIVIRLTYGNNSFMFTGDAETVSEAEILNNNFNLSADVIKVGHHGSTTSTSKDFLNAVMPKYAVISVGKDNSYNHPTKTTMDKLSDLNIPVYRTDEQGTIECVSNGTDITFNVEPGSYNYAGQ